MYSKILVPLDGSKLAEAALPHVEALAHAFQATVILLSVLELPILAHTSDQEQDDFAALPHVSSERLQRTMQERQAYLDSQSAQLCRADLACATRVAFGPVAATIMNTAVEENADLIAMASHGAGGLSGVYYGSVAAGVLQRVDRPLLIVRASVENQLS